MKFKTLFNRVSFLEYFKSNQQNKQPTSYVISKHLRDEIIQQIGNYQKDNVLLQQTLRTEKTQANAIAEDLFLELLEIGDALEILLNYLENNPDPSPEFLQRLPRSVGAVHRKFISLLQKRQVLPIQLEETQLDFNLCRVVDREIRTDLPEQTITKIVRQGFCWREKILRPAEVITSKIES